MMIFSPHWPRIFLRFLLLSFRDDKVVVILHSVVQCLKSWNFLSFAKLPNETFFFKVFYFLANFFFSSSVCEIQSMRKSALWNRYFRRFQEKNFLVEKENVKMCQFFICFTICSNKHDDDWFLIFFIEILKALKLSFTFLCGKSRMLTYSHIGCHLMTARLTMKEFPVGWQTQ